jgi:putative membrane protein
MIYPIFVLLIGLQHIGFALLEIRFWDKPLGRKIFRTSPEFAAQSKALAANQGLYNLFLAAGLLLSFFLDASSAHSFRFFFLGCVFVAGIFGGYTVNKRIFLIQAIPAGFALFFLVLGL